jgi:hypothetical protein
LIFLGDRVDEKFLLQFFCLLSLAFGSLDSFVSGRESLFFKDASSSSAARMSRRFRGFRGFRWCSGGEGIISPAEANTDEGASLGVGLSVGCFEVGC